MYEKDNRQMGADWINNKCHTNGNWVGFVDQP